MTRSISLWGLRAGDRGQDDQAGMKFHARGELPEIARIVGHDDLVFPDREREDVAIRNPLACLDRVGGSHRASRFR
jgi:hypothetical protein